MIEASALEGIGSASDAATPNAFSATLLRNNISPNYYLLRRVSASTTAAATAATAATAPSSTAPPPVAGAAATGAGAGSGSGGGVAPAARSNAVRLGLSDVVVAARRASIGLPSAALLALLPAGGVGGAGGASGVAQTSMEVFLNLNRR